MARKKTWEEWLCDFGKVHGNKYDYSKSKIVDSKEKIEILCGEHGSFWQSPTTHRKGHGCPSCGVVKQVSQRSLGNRGFIKKAKETHGDLYDYSKVDYVNANTKVEIICQEHGSFLQNAHNHTVGFGCPMCSGRWGSEKTQVFVDKSKEIHGDLYDYSMVEYIDQKTKVEIICPEHGSFWQSPSSHYLAGSGCPNCYSDRRMKTEIDEQMTLEFKKRAREVHGDRYDYSHSVYVNAKTKIEITCPLHGTFYQTYHKHLQGQRCPKCAGRGLSTEDLVNIFKEVHGDFYDYSKVEYSGSDDSVLITCEKHGDFNQLPSVHRKGHGCPKCSHERCAERMQNKPNFSKEFYSSNKNISNLYVNVVENKFIKVGLAISPDKRRLQLEKQSNMEVTTLRTISGKARDLWNLEQKILRHSGLNRYYPEVSFGGQSECLELSELPKVLEIIKEFEESLDSTAQQDHTEHTQIE